jgi:DNA-binding IclR family transcriptional regulator
MSKAPAVDYALDIMECFAINNCPMGISDISNALNINKNAVSRVLEAFIEKNWIYACEDNQKKYALTLRPFSLLSNNVRSNGIVRIATPLLENLNNQLGDAVYLGVKNGKNVLYLLHFDSKKEVRINGRVGGEYPLNCSAPGKVLLSYSESHEIKSYFNDSVSKMTENTIVDYSHFNSEATNIKQSGYAVDNEEFAKGIICIAAPVFDFDGRVVACVGLSTLTLYDSIDSLTDRKLELLKGVADEISKKLGYNAKE